MNLLEQAAAIVNAYTIRNLQYTWEDVAKEVEGYKGTAQDLKAFYDKYYFSELSHVMLIKSVERMWVENETIVCNVVLFGMPNGFKIGLLRLPNDILSVLLKEKHEELRSLLSQCTKAYAMQLEEEVSGPYMQFVAQEVGNAQVEKRTPEAAAPLPLVKSTPIFLKQEPVEAESVTTQQQISVDNSIGKFIHEPSSAKFQALQQLISKNIPSLLLSVHSVKEKLHELGVTRYSMSPYVTDSEAEHVAAMWLRNSSKDNGKAIITFIFTDATKRDVELPDLQALPGLQIVYNIVTSQRLSSLFDQEMKFDENGVLTIFDTECPLEKLHEYCELQIAYNYYSFELMRIQDGTQTAAQSGIPDTIATAETIKE